jgi:hypothetical protein
MIDACFQAIRTKLVATSAITTALSSSSAVYRLEAGQDAVKPYIVMAWSGGGDVNDNPYDRFDVRILVKAVAETAGAAGSLADAIRTALHGTELTYTGGWMHIQCQHISPIAYPEAVDRVTLYHMGGLYRLRASKR